MKKKTRRTIEQTRAIYCIEHGHPRIVNGCMGQITCARCDDIIGDTLMGSMDLAGYVVLGHACPVCATAARDLSRREMTYLKPEVKEEVMILRGEKTVVAA